MKRCFDRKAGIVIALAVLVFVTTALILRYWRTG